MSKSSEELNDELFTAVMADDHAKVERLLKAGANANALDRMDNLPLNLARDERVVESLLGAGANPNLSKNRRGYTPLHNARDPRIVKRLLDAGADPNLKDSGGNTPLYLYATTNDELVKLVLDAGADPNTKGDRGDSPLHRCVRMGIAVLLVDAGADPHAKNDAGKTPLDIRRGMIDGILKLPALVTKLEKQSKGINTDTPEELTAKEIQEVVERVERFNMSKFRGRLIAAGVSMSSKDRGAAADYSDARMAGAGARSPRSHIESLGARRATGARDAGRRSR